MGDFDDFFELDKEAKESPEKDKGTSEPASKPSAAQPPKTDDKLLGSFDALFEEAEKAPTQVSPPAAPPTPPASVPKQASADIDKLFDDLLVEDLKTVAPTASTPSRATTQTSSAPPVTVAPPKPAPKGGATDKELEELFVEVSEPKDTGVKENALEAQPAAEVGLGIEFKERRFRVPRKVQMAVPVFLGAAILTVLIMARFTTQGVFGWTFGQGPKDDYKAPSTKVLAQLNGRYAAASAFLMADNAQNYRKAMAEFEAVLRQDPRHSPTDARLAETILLLQDKGLNPELRKRVGVLLKQADKYHPGIIETVRAKARQALSSGNLSEGESLARKALTLNSKDFETVTLLGELAIARNDWKDAAEEFSRAIGMNPVAPRAKYYLAIVNLQQGKIDVAQESLRSLMQGTPLNPRSEIDYWRLLYSQRGQVDEARQGLEKLLKERAETLSDYDLGRGYRYIAEISEARNDMAGAIAAMEAAVTKDAYTPSNSFHLGQLYLARHDFEKAEPQFLRATNLSPDTPEYRIALGHVLREQGKPQESLENLKQAVEKAPQNVEGLYQLALTQQKLELTDPAISSLETLIKVDPRHADSMILLGELYVDRGKFQNATTQLRAALTIVPQSVHAHNVMGQVLLGERKWSEALAEFKAAEGGDARNAAVLRNLERTYLAMGRNDLASTYFEKASAVDPTGPAALIALGDLQYGRKEYTKALETYRKVLDAQPKDYDTRVKMARVLNDQQAFQEVITQIQEASKYRPDFYPGKLALGMALRGMGDLDGSLETLTEAIVLWPEGPEGYYELELTHIFRNDVINAQKALENALKYDPKYVEALLALGKYFSSRNVYGNAAEYFERANKIAPGNAAILLKLAELYQSDEKLNLAKKYFSETIQADKKAADAYVGLGMLAEEDHKSDQAMRYYKAAEAANPRNPKPYKLLGFMYRELDQKNAAIASFQNYLKLDPQSKERADIEDVIRSMKRE